MKIKLLKALVLENKQRGCLALLLLVFAILAVVILISAYADLNIIRINGP